MSFRVAVVEVEMVGETVPVWGTGMAKVAVREAGGAVVRYFWVVRYFSGLIYFECTGLCREMRGVILCVEGEWERGGYVLLRR